MGTVWHAYKVLVYYFSRREGGTKQLTGLLRSLNLQLRRQTKLILLLGVVLLMVCGVIALVWRHESTTPIAQIPEGSQQPPILLWWTIFRTFNVTRYCGPHQCTFTADRTKLAAAKGILFHRYLIKDYLFPLPRLPHHIWALLHEEPPRVMPYIEYEKMLQHFNFTATFSRHSDYPLTTMYLPLAQDLTSLKYVIPVAEKNELRKRENLASVVFLSSDCESASGREAYVEELMRYVDIDSYGQCLHNRDIPPSLGVSDWSFWHLFLLLPRYKFIIAYESAACYDYISEKIWQPFMFGSIPIYFGSPTIKEWEPNPKSAIYIKDFPSPEALANFIKRVDANDTEYNSYLKHKYDRREPISNKRLEHELLTRRYAIGKDRSFYRSFECFMCRRLYEMNPEHKYMATIKHYDCPSPRIYPPFGNMTYPLSNQWRKRVGMGRCMAHILNRLLQRNANYTKNEVVTLLLREVYDKKCQ